MNETQTREKTYTCGWCHHVHLNMNSDGTLETHYQPSTRAECRGQETYNQNGRAK